MADDDNLDNFESPRDELLSRMHATKGARFAANKRLEAKSWFNGYTISILSLYVICISVGLLVFGTYLDGITENILTFISVSLSVLIIIFSLLVASEKIDVKAELMHNCARDVLDLYSELKFSKNSDGEIETYRERYHSIINRYQHNHDNIDRISYLCSENKLSPSQSRFFYLRYFASTYLINILYLIGPAAFILLWLSLHQQPSEIASTTEQPVHQENESP